MYYLPFKEAVQHYELLSSQDTILGEKVQNLKEPFIGSRLGIIIWVYKRRIAVSASNRYRCCLKTADDLGRLYPVNLL